MKYIILLGAFCAAGCGRVEPAPAGDGFTSYTLNFWVPLDEYGRQSPYLMPQGQAGLDNAGLALVSFDQSVQVRDLTFLPPQPPFIGGKYKDRPFGQYMGITFSPPASGSTCDPEAIRIETEKLSSINYSHDLVRLRGLRVAFGVYLDTVVGATSIVSPRICFATHSAAGWKWHLEQPNFVVDAPGEALSSHGYFHCDYRLDETDVDQIAFAGRVGAGFSSITYEAAAYP